MGVRLEGRRTGDSSICRWTGSPRIKGNLEIALTFLALGICTLYNKHKSCGLNIWGRALKAAERL